MSLEELRALMEKDSFAKRLGAEVTRYGEGSIEFTIPVTADITQHHGFVHGSVLGFMADSACAWAATSVAGYVLTSEYKINLIAPAVGTRLIGRGYVVRAGGRQVICRADVFVEKGGEERMVATALATIVKISIRAAA